MFPLRDSTPRNSFPFINYLIIALNIYIFFLQISAPSFERFIYQHSFIPAEFNVLNLSSYRFILNSIFMHGGIFHIVSNMWFLHIFGDNVEDRMGHIGYLLFYLTAGLAAAIAQYFIAPTVSVPMLGASGAVSGIAGAYFVFFKNSTVKTLVPLFIIWTVIELPATFVLGYWFLTQIFAGVGSLAAVDVNQGGIAFFAHIGGFVFGYLIASNIKRG